MKEHFHGPQKWALVVISGGAACALPFVNNSEQSKGVRQQSPAGTTSLLNSANDVDQSALALPAPQFPEWANADRSPFDDLVGVKAREPAPIALADPLPLQPLQPWISGPSDFSSERAPIESTSASTPSAPHTALASTAERTPDEASPWRDRAGDWSAANALAIPSLVEPSSAIAFTDMRSTTTSPSMTTPSLTTTDTASPSVHPSESQTVANSAAAWPDQKLSAEEVAQLVRPVHRELASAMTAPAPVLLGQARAEGRGLNNDASSGSAGFATRPASGSHASLTSQSSASHISPPPFVPPSMSPASTAPYAPPPTVATMKPAATAGPSSLPKLPEARKQHIIFQPSSRR